MSYEDTILKLSRKYTDSEVIGLLRQKVSKLEIKHGQCKSYITELEDKEKSYQKQIKKLTEIRKQKGWKKQFLRDSLILELEKQIKALNFKISHDRNYSKLKKENQRLLIRERYLSKLLTDNGIKQ